MSNNAGGETTSPEQDVAKQAAKQALSKSQGQSNDHKRSVAGSVPSSLFAFLRSGHKSQNSDHGTKSECPSPILEEPPASPTAGPAAAVVIQQRSMRRRKGSLRKTALLGTGKMRIDGKERRGSSLEEVQTLDQRDGSTSDSGSLWTPASPHSLSTPRPLPVPPPVPMVTHPVHGIPSKILASSHQNETFQLQRPSTAQSTASTTDSDEYPTSPTSLSIPPLARMPMAPDSYFPPQPRLGRPHTPKSRSPLATLPPSIPSSPPSEWDYSETRWWGWIILIVTWIVFVVGMGSCFEVWSWAWDVGETPYAPPELEDDPTLPIVGYYPALIILTGVMAWVWVTVAWVGMKYFKHANISGD